MEMSFPCLVYNIGLSLIKVQSTINPDVCATINFHEREFLAFVHYRDFVDIGLIDKRSSSEKRISNRKNNEIQRFKNSSKTFIEE